MPVTAKQLVLASILALTIARADDTAQSSQADPIESAKRELKELPTLKGASRLPGTDEVSIPLPAFHAPGALSLQQAPLARPEGSRSSQGWLLDALQGNDRLPGLKRTSSGGRGPNRSDTPHQEEPVLGRNPLDRYMVQWMTPQSRSILSQTQVSRALPEGPPSSISQSWRVDPMLENRSNKARAGLFPESRRVNPYLESDNDSTGWVGSTLQIPDSANLRTIRPVGDFQQVIPSPVRSASDELLKPHQQLVPYTPPTAPLVDEQKYFPQLRKF